MILSLEKELGVRCSSAARAGCGSRPWEKFTVAAYPCNMIAHLLADFCAHWQEEYRIEHYEGAVEKVGCIRQEGEALSEAADWFIE